VEFIKGASARGVDGATAREIFELIISFGGYGFNKSHSAAYALIGYHTAYLKAHYTSEFMAALLSSEIEDGNKRDIMVQHMEDARRLGAEVLPPNVNESDVEFTVANGKILFGLTAIKGLGRAAATELVRARQAEGPFKDLYDFCERIDLRVVPRSAIEKLIMAGAFDCVGARRAQWWHVLPRALQAAGEAQEDRRVGQRNFFEALEGGSAGQLPVQASLPDVPEWPHSEKLKNEKLALDFYWSSHPLAQHASDLSRICPVPVERVLQMNANQPVRVGGLLTNVRLMNTKKARNGNSRYLRCKLEDLTGSVECVMWPDDFARHKDEIRDDQVCIVEGTVERTRELPGIVVNRILTIEQAKRHMTGDLWLSLVQGMHVPEQVDQIARILERAPGTSRVYVLIRDGAGKKCLLKSDERLRVDATAAVMDELQMIVGPNRVEFRVHPSGNGRNGR
jgi:DNA polymerase-3 subunit alpha